MKLFFDDTEFDGQLQRTAAKAAYGSADLGEVFAVAGRITPGDYDSWYREWFSAGEQNRDLSEAEHAKGHGYNALVAGLRAAEHFRSAYFFCRRDLGGDDLLTAFRASRDAFRSVLPLMPHPFEVITYPYEGVELPGYLALPPGADGPLPVVVLPCGYDSPTEEFWTLGGADALARGFAVATFAGPGQAEVLYELGLPFRHDTEAVLAPVVDVLQARPELDGDRIALVGRSFGGYLAPRAASHEPRIRALAADPAQTDMFANLKARFPAEWIDMVERGDPAFNDAVWQAFPGVHGQEFWLSRARSHGKEDPLAYVTEMKRWVVDVEAITCPTFVSYGEGDFAQSTADEFYDRLTCPKERRVYREADGGGGHCEGMGPARYFNDLFGWLADVL